MPINKRLLPLKGHFFFFFGSMAPILPFVMVLAVQLGIPVPLQGSLSAFSLLFTIVGKPLVAGLADVFPSYRKVLFLVTVSIMVASFSAINFIPSLQAPIAVRGIMLRDFESSSPIGDNQSIVSKTFLSIPTSAAVPKINQSSIMSSSKTDPSITRPFEANLQSIDGGDNDDEDDVRSFSTDHHHHRLILAAFDDSSAYMTIGKECSFECSSQWFCPVHVSANKKVIGDFIIKPISGFSSQHTMMSTSSSQIPTEVLPIHGGNKLSIKHLYHLEGVKMPLSSFKANVSIMCKSGERSSAVDSHRVAWTSWQFWLLAVFLIVGQLAFNTAVSITDAIAVDTVGDNGSYGVQRAWGTIGWGVMAPISGLLVDWWSGSSITKDYSPAFLLCFIAGFLDVILSTVYLKVPKMDNERNILRKLWPLLKQPRFFVFCCFVILNGCFDGIVVNYIFLMQEDMVKGTSAMGNMKFLQGLTLLVQGAVEAPFMFVYGWFMKKLGAQKVTSLVFFLYVFRLLGLFVVGQYGSVWTTLLPELLNGPCYGLGYTAIVTYAAKITPSGTSNTVQSAVNICYESFGYALSMFVGGLIYNQMGGPYMYLMASGVALCTFICHIISLKLLPLPKESNKCEENSSNKQDLSQEDLEESKALGGNELVDV